MSDKSEVLQSICFGWWDRRDVLKCTNIEELDTHFPELAALVRQGQLIDRQIELVVKGLEREQP